MKHHVVLFLGVVHTKLNTVGKQRTAIANLPARLAVKRRTREYQRRGFTCFERVARLAIDINCRNITSCL